MAQAVTRYPGLEEYILDALSSYFDTERDELEQRVRDSYGEVNSRAFYRYVAKLVKRGDVVKVDFGVYRRRRGGEPVL